MSEPSLPVFLRIAAVQHLEKQWQDAVLAKVRSDPFLSDVFRQIEFDAAIGNRPPGDLVEALGAEGKDDEADVTFEQSYLPTDLVDGASNPVILGARARLRKQRFGQIEIDWCPHLASPSRRLFTKA